MGRKRNQGKARKAAKAKAREEAEESNNQVTNERQLLAEQILQLQNGIFLPTSGSDTTKCYHGFKEMDNMCIDFVIEFREAFHEAGKMGKSTMQSLIEAKNVTMENLRVCGKILPTWKSLCRIICVVERKTFLKVMIVMPMNVLFMLGTWNNGQQFTWT